VKTHIEENNQNLTDYAVAAVETVLLSLFALLAFSMT
jgi:hypothetical protein